MEIKMVEGYENYYVDKEGNVYRKLKPSWKKNEKRTYKQIVLNEPGKVKTVMVHRLVAKAFLPNPNNLSSVHHKNGDKLDNTVENLEWIDEKDHRALHVAMGECRVNNFKNCSLYKAGEFVADFKSVAEASRYAVEHFGSKYYSLTKDKKHNDVEIVLKV